MAIKLPLFLLHSSKSLVAANKASINKASIMSDDDSVSSTESIVEEKEVEEVTDLSNS